MKFEIIKDNESLEEFAERMEETKQETLEEVGEKNFINIGGVLVLEDDTKSQQSYSEEEVIELLQKAVTHQDNEEIGDLVTAQGKIRMANFYSWFEQFKKK